MELLEARVVLDARVVISEFLASNDKGLVDEDGEASDWIELLNISSDVVDLGGWHLTDEAQDSNKWTLPRVSIGPGQHRVVFASGKDHDNPLRPLHTNFKLSADGEYLALTRPDESVEFALAPQFPQQVEDVSYGVPNASTQTLLVGSGAVAHVYLPTDGQLDPDPLSEDLTGSWLDPALDTSGPGWFAAAQGIGYYDPADDPNPLPGSGTLIADSVAEFSQYQNRNSWRYGYWNKTADANGAYDALTADFRPFVWSGLTTISANNHWDGSKWDLAVAPSPPQTELRADGGQPAGRTTGTDVHHSIRRWTSEIKGSVLISGRLEDLSAAGDGVVGRILVDGQTVFSRQVNGAGVDYRVVAAVDVGQRVDFVIDPGEAGREDGDNTIFTARIEDVTSLVGGGGGVPTMADEIATNIETQMKGVASSVYVRIPFTPAAADFDALTLNVKYDDAFVAYLNGQPIAAAGGPDAGVAVWNSVADSDRNVQQALSSESFNVTGARDLLIAGTQNVLMLHGLNRSIDNKDFLLQVELVGTRLDVQPDQFRYFVEPTPGEANGLGDATVGPVFVDRMHTPATPLSTQPLLVTARVARAFAPVAQVDLKYRVMYATERSLRMVDDGSSGDAVAGDGVYTATIPAAQAQPGQMIRWYMTSQDTQGKSSRYPRFDIPSDTEEYFGTIVADTSVSSNLPVFHWFVATPSAAFTSGGTRGSLYYDGEFYDNVQFDLHGQSSSGFPTEKKSMDVDFPSDHRFRWSDDVGRMKDINLLTNFADKSKLRNTLAYEQHEFIGDGYLLAYPVRVQRNGQFFAVYDFVEDGDDRWLDRLGLDPEGALYKMYNSLEAATGEKKTRRDEGNSDLQALVSGISQSGQARTNYIFDNINLAAMANYLAGFVITSNQDCCHKNYYAYRDTNGTGEWYYMPWDVDLTQGRNWGGFGLAYFDDTMYPNNPLYMGQNNRLISALYATPGFREMYLRRVRSLIDAYVKPPGTPYDQLPLETRVDQLVQLMAADAALDNQKHRATWGQTGFQSFEQATNILKTQYAGPRREFLYTQGGGPIPLAQVGYPKLDLGSLEFNPASGNQDEEYLQLVNSNKVAVDISGWRLEGGIQWQFPPGTVLPAGWSLYVTPSARAFRTRTTGPRGGQSLFVQGNYDGHLSNFGETIQLQAADGTLVNAWTYEGDPTDVQQYLRVTEIMYHPLPPSAAETAVNSAWTDEDFEFIELQNTSTDVTLDMAGVRFTDGVIFDFTAGSIQTLAPQQRLLVVKNGAAFAARYGDSLSPLIAGEFQLASGLRDSGEVIKLEDATQSTVLEFAFSDDADLRWPARADGQGSSLQIVDLAADPADSLSWRPSVQIHGSPGATDRLPGPSIVINEVLSRPVAPQWDAVELYNAGTTPVALGDFYLSDDAAESLAKFRLPAIVLGPGEYLVLDERQFGAGGVGAPGAFGLSGTHGDQLLLTQGDTHGPGWFVDHVSFPAAAGGESFGRAPYTVGGMAPLVSTSLQSANGAFRVGPVVLSEVHYHPAGPSTAALAIDPTLSADDLEFIELHNPTPQPIALDGWRLRGDVDFDFTAQHTLAAGEALLLVPFNPLRPDNAARVAAFRAQYGLATTVRLWGGYAGQLDNGGQRITLNRPDAPTAEEPDYIPRLLVDEVWFDDEAPWPISADGQGDSLQRQRSAGLGSDPASWRAAAPAPGAVEFIASLPGDFSGDGRLDATDIDLFSQQLRSPTPSLACDLNGDGRVDGLDRDQLIFQEFNSTYGDADLNRAFNSGDLVFVFSAGEYEDNIPGNSTWNEGDWNGDGDFDSGDIVLAFAAGGYEVTARPRAARAMDLEQVAGSLLAQEAIDAVFAGTGLDSLARRRALRR